MNTSAKRRDLSELRVLLVGAGGVGAPCALALAEAGVGYLRIADDDQVELGNLHRQILFTEGDVGRSKLEATKAALLARAPSMTIDLREGRALPSTALALMQGVDVVVDACDNFPTRFLLADAAHLQNLPIVHAAAIRWQGTVLATKAGGGPCYRCLFEDIPEGPAPDCATGGIVGPVVGVIGAIAAEMALSAGFDERRLTGHIATFDGQRDELRLVEVARREGCPLCGPRRTISTLDEARYLGGTFLGGFCPPPR